MEIQQLKKEGAAEFMAAASAAKREGKKKFKFGGKEYPVTNVLTGIQQPTISKDNNMIIFAGYANIGWDLYSLSNPLNLKKRTVEPTQFILGINSEESEISDLRKHKSNLQPKNKVSLAFGDPVRLQNFIKTSILSL